MAIVKATLHTSGATLSIPRSPRAPFTLGRRLDSVHSDAELRGKRVSDEHNCAAG